MLAFDTTTALGRYSVANLCSAHPQVQAMDSSLKPLFRGARMCGPARTAQVVPGQNAAIHRAIHHAQRGEVLVIDCGGNRSFGPFGDILATACVRKGIAGLVIDSTIRDTAEIEKMRFPVFCLGANPCPTDKSDAGHVDLEIDCAGVRVRPGDIVVGDDDGVVVVNLEIAEAVSAMAAALVSWEASVKARIMNGETTCEILGIRPRPNDRS